MKCDDGLIDIAAYITEGQSNSYSWNKLYRREIWQINKFPKMVYEDLDILIPIMSRCRKISYVHQALYNYYKHSDSTTSAYTNPRLFQIFKAYEDLITNSTDRYKLEAQFCAVKRILINMNTVGFNYYLSYFILLLRKIYNLNNDNYLINNNEKTKDIQYYSNREILPQNIFVPEFANLKAWNYYKFDEKIMPYSDDLRATIDKLFAEGGLLILGKLNPQAPIGYLRSLNNFILLDTNGQVLIVGLSAKHPLANLLVNSYDNEESLSVYFDKILANKDIHNRLLNEVTVININTLDNKVLFARY
ncbi:hypothetical protein [Lactobacillus sp. ESL0677]|uniref:hypothetical protein n=1 Tax=Lactobacillus sp. ESL0677 TaxID=2983208 RepID=UPI0023F656CF|nr:hypothetical protein [Lactobacillus sp. ESL0677]WEV37426.1 hypothetical protein OZX76_02400 [Lactobacillus sp. ESL0677]